MAQQIEDGTGSGKRARVTESNRLSTVSVQNTAHAASALAGESFNLSMAELTITNDTENALWYLKNNTDKTLVVDDVYLNHAASTGGTGRALVKVVRNPTGGTVVSDANVGTVVNRNFGSTKASGLTWYTASAVGKTLTGGDTAFTAHRTAGAQSIFSWAGTVVLPPGASIGLTYTAPASNTSQLVIVNATVHFLQDTDY